MEDWIKNIDREETKDNTPTEVTEKPEHYPENIWPIMIVKEAGRGRVQECVRISYSTNTPIVYDDYVKPEDILYIAEALELEIPKPISYVQLKHRNYERVILANLDVALYQGIPKHTKIVAISQQLPTRRNRRFND